MRVQSDEFNRLVRGSHISVTEVELWRAGTLLDTLPVVGGSVSASLSGAVRRSCEFQIADPLGEYTPRSSADALHPTGTEAVVKRGVLLASGSYEWCSLGTFRLMNVSTDAGASGALHTCTGYDRSYLLQTPMQTPYTIATGVNVGSAIVSLLTTAMPAIQIRAYQSAYTTPQAIFDPQTSPWTIALDLARGIGADLYFDADGYCNISPVDYLSGVSVWDFAQTTWALKRTLGAGVESPSIVVVEGTNSGNTGLVRGVAFDNDPTSPTFYLGPYGSIVRYETNSRVSTQAQAQEAAAFSLRHRSRVAETYTFECVPNPAFAEGDIVMLDRAALSMAPLQCVIVDIRTPLDMSAQQISVQAAAALREVGVA